jgi:CheY-like chemotaxis protein
MEQRPSDPLILDVMFPQNESAGFELARTIRRKDGKLRNIPIPMLTAVNTKFPLGFGPSDVDDHWLPIDDFVEKPVDLNVLRKRVAALLEPAA